jgi:hypothetical protein
LSDNGFVVYEAVVTLVGGRGFVEFDLVGPNLDVVTEEVVFCENGISVLVDLYEFVIIGFLAIVNASVTGFIASTVLNDIAIGL